MTHEIKLTRRAALGALAGAMIMPASAAWAQSTPSAGAIERSLSAPSQGLSREQRVSPRVFKKRHDLRRIAPSVDIQSINFAFGSHAIPRDQYWKVERIAVAMKRILRRNRRELFLIEGHTDAVGSYSNNLTLSERRARSLARQLIRFGVRRSALETIGYGEEDLLVPTQQAEWRNRRVTLRRITDFVTLR